MAATLILQGFLDAHMHMHMMQEAAADNNGAAMIAAREQANKQPGSGGMHARRS